MLSLPSNPRPLIMGILNMTPDSFSGDGLIKKPLFIDEALAQARQMIKDGAHILDIGGQSTRPGASPVNGQEEKRRVLPLIEALRETFPHVPLSIDTMKADVATDAVKAGANILNDISGFAQDPAMRALAIETGAYLVMMHNQAHHDKVVQRNIIGGEYQAPDYNDVVKEVSESLYEMAQKAEDEGLSKNKIILDPGIGFGKTPQQNLALIHHLKDITALGYPVLLGASRKSFIGHVLETTANNRLGGDIAVTTIATQHGATILRVHDVAAQAQAAKMAATLIKE